jgi:hypothetical protein
MVTPSAIATPYVRRRGHDAEDCADGFDEEAFGNVVLLNPGRGIWPGTPSGKAVIRYLKEAVTPTKS